MGSISVIRKPPHYKTFGLEIECRPNSIDNVKGPHGRKYVGFWEVTKDGSLGRDELEFISQPMPYEAQIRQIKTLWKRLEGWTVSSQCGLHIHVSRKMWTDKKEEKFTKLLRSLSHLQMTTLFGRFSTYAEPNNSKYSKYRAVNLQHEHTYEFRLWKAGDLEWTLEALRRTRAVVLYNGEWSYEQCLKLFNLAASKSPVAERPVAVPAVRHFRRP